MASHSKNGNDYESRNAGSLPVGFKLTGLKPEPWTIQDPVLRAGGFGDATAKLTLAQNVSRSGETEVPIIKNA